MFFIWIVCAGVNAIAQEGGLPPGRRKVVQSTKNDSEKGVAKRTRSKIVNDSVKIIYGPKTTLSTTEKEIFENKKNYVPLDTSIFNRHRWDFVQKNENKYQDLGNVGTALNPIFPLLSGMIGATSGFKVYDLYYESAEPRFYNTKSPFSRINIMWGGRGRSITHIEFTRNINSRWNFGINYRPVLSAAQIGYSGNKNYQVTSHYYDFYTSYESKNSKYKLLLSYRRIRHHVKENGGVFLQNDSIATYKDYFDPNVGSYFAISTSSTTPPAATTDELRKNVHLFHQYQLAKPAQLYHALDVISQVNTFHSVKGKETTNYFSTSFIDTTVINDVNTFQSVQNEVGLKGNAAFLFYDFYYKLRTYSNNTSNLQGQAPRAIGTENYIGSRVTLKYDSLSYLSGQAEYLLDGHYKIEGALRSPWLDADLRSSLAKAGFMQQAYRGGFNVWSNNFTDVFSNQLSGRIKAKLGPLFISPGFSYTALHNYIYFHADSSQKAIPMQSGGNQQIVSPELKMEVRFFKRFHLRPHVIYTTLFNNDDHTVSIPAWFTNIQLSYENIIFKGALQLQVGFDTHYKSAYKAMGYAPAIQQYYIQDNFINTPFWSTDFFLNGRIKRGRFFVKYVNLVQMFTGQGYLPTPYYPNVRSTVDFGFELILFD
ncbi:MAG: hypothetical protein HYR67_18895 [Bacteroidetes bacterium]|nr:hypothetical protein [Bacteroidota bacterium]